MHLLGKCSGNNTKRTDFRKRLPDAAYELNGILSDEVLAGSDVPVLILANKIDLPDALGEYELVQRLGIGDRQAWLLFSIQYHDQMVK